MSKWREFRFTRKGKADLCWFIKQEAETYRTKHGQLDGQFQEFSDTPGPKGKEDTAAYVNAVDNCAFNVLREVRKKTEGGYIEYVNGKPIEKQITEISFDDYLPKNLCFGKPQTSITDATLAKLHKEGKTRYSRKYDGYCHIACHHSWGWEIYSRRMDLMTGHFRQVVQELKQHKSFKPGTILIGEMICLKNDGKDDFKAISRVCRSLEEEAVKLVDLGEVPEPVFVVFDIAFYNYQDLKDKSYDERSKLWKDSFTALAKSKNESICSVDCYNLTPDTWQECAKKEGLEGFVLNDGLSVPGVKMYSFNGKAERPKGCFKLKVTHTEDCVIYAGMKGTGKRLNGLGSVFMKQKHPETGMWFDVGKCGSGFTEENLLELEQMFKKQGLPILEKEKELTDELLNSNNGIPMVLEYSERQPGTNKFRFPVFLHTRLDKNIEECEAQRLAPEEE